MPMEKGDMVKASFPTTLNRASCFPDAQLTRRCGASGSAGLSLSQSPQETPPAKLSNKEEGGRGIQNRTTSYFALLRDIYNLRPQAEAEPLVACSEKGGGPHTTD